MWLLRQRFYRFPVVVAKFIFILSFVIVKLLDITINKPFVVLHKMLNLVFLNCRRITAPRIINKWAERPFGRLKGRALVQLFLKKVQITYNILSFFVPVVCCWFTHDHMCERLVTESSHQFKFMHTYTMPWGAIKFAFPVKWCDVDEHHMRSGQPRICRALKNPHSTQPNRFAFVLCLQIAINCRSYPV